jgi:uncharacterized protein (DUF924 family)
MNHPEAVLEFWFGAVRDYVEYLEASNQRWFEPNPAFDAAIRDRFFADWEQAAAGLRPPWVATPRGRLALILMLDQFSRNLWRKSPTAFAQDAAARELVHEGLSHGQDRSLAPVECIFFYLPLQHSESMEDQRLSLSLYTRLRDEAPPTLRQAFEGTLDYAIRHADSIERFGRFPHRNAILGRKSTDEERHFLTLPGSSF